MANRQGILPRLDFIDALSDDQRSGERRWEHVFGLSGEPDPASLCVIGES